jgi:hypothetical protein
MDGASVLGGFVRIVLRNSLPGVLSTALSHYPVLKNSLFVRGPNFTRPWIRPRKTDAGNHKITNPPCLFQKLVKTAT